MTDETGFPDVEKVLRVVLGDLADVATNVPPDPDGTLAWLPLLRVRCNGGGDNRTTDVSRVDVDAFAASKAAASDLAEAARQRLLNRGRAHVGDVWVLDGIRTDSKPHEVPYVDNPPPYRYTAAYSVSARRLATA